MTVTRLLLIITSSAIFTNCGSDTSKGTENKMTNQGYENREWFNGLKPSPHESINQEEFSKQYTKNATWWDKAFEFLKNNDLNQMSPGTYYIDSNNVFAIISEVATKDKDNVKWEKHRNYNDLQYIINGKAKMGVASTSDPGVKVIVPYDSEDNEFFSTEGGKFYDAGQGSFFIFTPHEIHKPAFKIQGYDTIKKMVLKVKVP